MSTAINERDKALYPNEIKSSLFTLSKEYKGLLSDDIGYYLDMSNKDYDIKVYPPKTPLDEFECKVFVALLHIALTDDTAVWFRSNSDEFKASIRTSTSYYKVMKLLGINDDKYTYIRIKKAFEKINSTYISVDTKNDNSLRVFKKPLVGIDSDTEGNFVYLTFYEIIVKNIMRFKRNYTLLHLNNFIKLKNRASSILILYLSTLKDIPEVSLPTIVQNLYNLDNESYKNLHRSTRDKYLTDTIEALQELINNENKEPIINNIKLVIQKPKSKSFIKIKYKNEITYN